MKRDEILEEARKIVTGKRVDRYGNPEDNFTEIAKYWSLYLGIEISPKDVALMMCYLKFARIKTGKLHLDNFVDAAGYIACAGELECKRNKQ